MPAVDEMKMFLTMHARLRGFEVFNQLKGGVQDTQQSMRLLQGRLHQVTGNFKKGQQAGKRFNFEMLGVMFAGMALKNAMFQLLSPGLQVVGIFDIWADTLEVTFLPIAEKVLEKFLLPLSDKLMSLPKPVQEAIGAFVLLAGIIGGVVMVIGMLALAKLSIIKAFPGLVGVITAVFGSITSAIGGIIAFVASFISIPLVIAGILALVLISIIFNLDGWINAFVNFVKNVIGIIASLAKGIVDIITGVFDLLIGIIIGFGTGDWSKAWEGLSKIVSGVFSIIKAILFDLPASLITLGFDIIKAFAKGIINAYGFVKDAILGLPFIGPIVSGVASATGGLFGGLTSGLSSIMSSIGIPGFAAGGIVTGPTLAMVGEKGPEAIVPLGNGGNALSSGETNVFINNSGPISSDIDMRRLADMVSEAMRDEYRRQTFAR